MSTSESRNRVVANRGGWLSGRTPFVILGAVLFVYVCYPFVAFLWRLDGFDSAAATDPATLSAVRYSLTTAPVATVLATVFGVPLAYVLARSSFRGKSVVEALVIVPLVLPPVVAGLLLLTGFGSLTPVGSFARSMGIRLTDSYVGIVLAQTFVASPFVVITSRAGFAGIDDQLEEAARSLGSSPVETFWNVSVPLARNSILAGIVLTFARAVGEFGATMLVAYHPHTMPVQIWVAFGSQGLDATVPLVVLLALIGFSVVFALQALGRTPTLTR